MSFKRPIDVDARIEVLAANELEFLADRSLELAIRYERDAVFMEDDEGRQIALALSRWRRRRGQYFRELSAEAERTEAQCAQWAGACLRAPMDESAQGDLARRMSRNKGSHESQDGGVPH